jgi:hypothetical protein
LIIMEPRKQSKVKVERRGFAFVSIFPAVQQNIFSPGVACDVLIFSSKSKHSCARCMNRDQGKHLLLPKTLRTPNEIQRTIPFLESRGIESTCRKCSLEMPFRPSTDSSFSSLVDRSSLHPMHHWCRHSRSMTGSRARHYPQTSKATKCTSTVRFVPSSFCSI